MSCVGLIGVFHMCISSTLCVCLICVSHLCGVCVSHRCVSSMCCVCLIDVSHMCLSSTVLCVSHLCVSYTVCVFSSRFPPVSEKAKVGKLVGVILAAAVNQTIVYSIAEGNEGGE